MRNIGIELGILIKIKNRKNRSVKLEIRIKQTEKKPLIEFKFAVVQYVTKIK